MGDGDGIDGSSKDSSIWVLLLLGMLQGCLQPQQPHLAGVDHRRDVVVVVDGGLAQGLLRRSGQGQQRALCRGAVLDLVHLAKMDPPLLAAVHPPLQALPHELVLRWLCWWLWLWLRLRQALGLRWCWCWLPRRRGGWLRAIHSPVCLGVGD